MAKYVILLYFYVSLLQNHKKNIKIQDQIRLKKKKNLMKHLHHSIIGFQIIGKQLKFWSNLRWVKYQILNHK